jgi:hypothetical protein
VGKRPVYHRLRFYMCPIVRPEYFRKILHHLVNI